VKVLSGKQMCRVLEQRGWTLARINGSHHIYRHADTGRRAVGRSTATTTSSPARNAASCATPD
jgi:predicted RNA binding protein YcfA (HicA-like mRNA interferase family)